MVQQQTASVSKSTEAPPDITPRTRKPKDKSFVFRDIVTVIRYTGMRSSTLDELRSALAKVSDESIFHHTCQYFLKGHIHEHTNDFSHWAAVYLEESVLAEQLSNVDPYSFKNIRELRRHLLNVIDLYRREFPKPSPVRQGEEFYFSEADTFVFPAGLKARNLAEFLMAIKFLDSSSIYYHFYEARSRLRSSSDDFSAWIRAVMKAPEIADRLAAIDPFMNNVEGIRQLIIVALEEGIRAQMEAAE